MTCSGVKTLFGCSLPASLKVRLEGPLVAGCRTNLYKPFIQQEKNRFPLSIHTLSVYQILAPT